MTFGDQQFSVVLDKGTIDALMSNRTEQVRRTSSWKEEDDLRFSPTGPIRYQSDLGRSGSSSSCHRSIHLHHLSAETHSRSSFGTFLPSKVTFSFGLSEHFLSTSTRSWLLRYHHIQTSKSFALPVFAFVFTKMTLKTPVSHSIGM